VILVYDLKFHNFVSMHIDYQLNQNGADGNSEIISNIICPILPEPCVFSFVHDLCFVSHKLFRLREKRTTDMKFCFFLHVVKQQLANLSS